MNNANLFILANILYLNHKEKERTARADRYRDMLSLKEFIERACEGSGVQNDSTNAWVAVDGITCSVKIGDVLDHDEKEPFEASEYLENHLDSPVWDDLYEQYEQYCSDQDEQATEE